jgi:hypothetical protein
VLAWGAHQNLIRDLVKEGVRTAIAASQEGVVKVAALLWMVAVL